MITSSNVLDDTHVLDGQEMKDMVELWCAFYEDACKGASLPDRRSDRVLIKQWLTARYHNDESLDGRDVADFDKADGYSANGYRIPLDKEELVGSDDEADLGPKVAWLNQLHKMNARAAPFVPAH